MTWALIRFLPFRICTLSHNSQLEEGLVWVLCFVNRSRSWITGFGSNSRRFWLFVLLLCYLHAVFCVCRCCRLFVSCEYIYVFYVHAMYVCWFRFPSLCMPPLLAAFRLNITVVPHRWWRVRCWLRIVNQRRFVGRCGGTSHLLGSGSIRMNWKRTASENIW